MEITVNGTPRTLAAPTTVAALLEELQVDADTGIAVLLNGDVIRRAAWAQTTVPPAAEVEIVRPTVGG